MKDLTAKEKRIIDWARLGVVSLTFGAVYALAPRFIVGAFFGYMFMLTVLKFEDRL